MSIQVDEKEVLKMVKDGTYITSVMLGDHRTWKTTYSIAERDVWGTLRRYYVTSCNDLICESGIHLYVSEGGIASNIMVSNSGGMVISSGGIAENVDYRRIDTSTALVVLSGGSASLAFNPWQGRFVSSAGAVVTSLDRDQNVYLGGVSSGLIYKGGGISQMHISGKREVYVFSGGSANRIELGNRYWGYGYMYVSSGGIANSITVDDNGLLSVSSGGTATNIVENGGYVYVAESANVTFTPNTISSITVDRMTVHSGTTAVNVTQSGLFTRVESGGVVYSTTVEKGRLEISSGGIAESTTVNSGGTMYISSGGTANYVVIESGGYLEKHIGGTALNIVSRAGAVIRTYA